VHDAARVHGMFFLSVCAGVEEDVGTVPAVVVSSSFFCAAYTAACTLYASMTGPYRRVQIDFITLTSVPGCHGWRGGGHARCPTLGNLTAPCTLLFVVSGFTGIIISVDRSCRDLYRWWFTGGSYVSAVCHAVLCRTRSVMHLFRRRPPQARVVNDGSQLQTTFEVVWSRAMKTPGPPWHSSVLGTQSHTSSAACASVESSWGL